MTKEFASIDCGRDDSADTETKGCRIYSREGDEYGVSLGKCGDYYGPAGPSSRIRVLWPNGLVTRCNVRGILFRNNRWQIS